jgi:cytochrome c peroxidase
VGEIMTNERTKKMSIWKRIGTLGICTLVAVLVIVGSANATPSSLSPKERLGQLIFFDSNLSEPVGQACDDCHGKDVGWTGPNEASNILRGGVYHGANISRFGNRKPPTLSYSNFIPNFKLEDTTNGTFVGGSFWDGRATGEIRGTAPADQATLPFLNPLEMNNPDGNAVVDKVCSSGYVDLFKQVWGKNACNDKKKAFDKIAFSIVAFEGSKEVSPFSSKFDAYLDGKVKLTNQEMRGLNLFRGKAICDTCHVSEMVNGKHPLFTNFKYGDPGTPRNPQNPFYNETEFNPAGAAYIDPGLAGHIENVPKFLIYQRENYGKQKIPTLRNVDKRPNSTFMKRYMHNGFFGSLKDVVHFYNTRDVLPVCGFKGSDVGKNCWPLPEVALNANPKVGHLGLTNQEETDIVAFLGTLSDGFEMKK